MKLVYSVFFSTFGGNNALVAGEYSHIDSLLTDQNKNCVLPRVANETK
jgi:hypothetical protein